MSATLELQVQKAFKIGPCSLSSAADSHPQIHTLHAQDWSFDRLRYVDLDSPSFTFGLQPKGGLKLQFTEAVCLRTS